MPKVNDDRRALLDAVGVKLREVAGLSVLYSQAMAARLGINRTDLECLDLLSFGSKVTAGALAERTGLTTGAMTTAIDRLERAGFVRRRRDAADRRKVVVAATSAGRRHGEPPRAPMRKIVSQVLNRYEDEQLRFLSQVLGELCEAAKQVIALTHSQKRSREPRTTGKSHSQPGSPRTST
jgi:DNA-binding MarR family transcriptional regulator